MELVRYATNRKRWRNYSFIVVILVLVSMSTDTGDMGRYDVIRGGEDSWATSQTPDNHSPLVFGPDSDGFKSSPATQMAAVDLVARSRINRTYGTRPLSFEVNRGQAEHQVKFLARGQGYSLFLTDNEAILDLQRVEPTDGKSGTSGLTSVNRDRSMLRMRLVGANPGPLVVGEDELPGKYNYLFGRDRGRWNANISTYAKVRYEEVYPGVDLVYYGSQQRVEYDFVVSPGADPAMIRLSFEGARRVEVDARGDLVLSIPGGRIRQRKPRVYQQVEGLRREVAANYVLEETGQVGFSLGPYDVTESLVIDPVFVFSTYLGGRRGDGATGIAVDDEGNIYVTGGTLSPKFPTANALQGRFGGGRGVMFFFLIGGDAFVTKLSPDGSELIYSTYLGGSSDDIGFAIAVDGEGNAYVTGITTSSNFPTVNAVQRRFGGFRDAFVAKLNATGDTLIYSTYLGGNGFDEGLAIDADDEGNAYVTGDTLSTNFPTSNPLQPSFRGGIGMFFPFGDAYVAKLGADGSMFIYSTYLGGKGSDVGVGIAADDDGNAYVTGATTSTDFPTANPFQPRFRGNGTVVGVGDAFVSKLNPEGSALIYSTYLGGRGSDVGAGIALDAEGNAYVAGATGSNNFPTMSPFQSEFGGGGKCGLFGLFDAFVTKLNAAGDGLVYSTYLGGRCDDGAARIVVDADGNAYVTGATASDDFPTMDSLQPLMGGRRFGGDAFVTKFNAAGDALAYSTILGGSGDDITFGIALNAMGDAYVAGSTASKDFPTVNALQPGFGKGDGDAFVVMLADEGEPQ